MGKNPKYRSLFLSFGIMFFISLVSPAYAPQSIPSPVWLTLAAWLAFFAALLSVVVIFLPFFVYTPKDARDKTFPMIALLAAFSLLIVTAGYRSMLIDLLPLGVAQFAGHHVVNTFSVLGVRPVRYQKFCRSSLKIRTPAGIREICNLPPAVLEALSPGDSLAVSGKMTPFGQTIENVAVAK